MLKVTFHNEDIEVLNACEPNYRMYRKIYQYAKLYHV